MPVYFTFNGFRFFGVPPALGHGLQPSDAIDGQDPQPVVVLGYKFWQRHFNGDPSGSRQDHADWCGKITRSLACQDPASHGGMAMSTYPSR